MRKVIWEFRLIWLLPVVLVVAFLVFLVARPRGVLISVTNTGVSPMRNVRAIVTGGSYPLGTLMPNETKDVRANPTSESHVEFTYLDGDIPQKVVVDCYFEQEYSGRIDVDIKDGAVVRITDQTSVGY